MPPHFFASLVATLAPHFNLGKTRLETLAVLISGVVNARTVNLTHLASQFPGEALLSSNYRRLQRFFFHVHLDTNQLARLSVQALHLERPKILALDRTNWKLGKRDINILMLAVVTRRFRIPLMWVLLDHQGNSDSARRIALLERYLSLFGAASIECVLADREFIGTDWLKFLMKNNIPFVIRLRADLIVQCQDGRRLTCATLMRRQRSVHKIASWSGWLNGFEPIKENQLDFAARRIKGGELLIVVTNKLPPQKALNAYRKRWRIECLFADTKTRGFNLEDTHLTNPKKLDTLIAIIMLALTWSYRCASQTMGRKNIGRKTHGRREKSWFRTGLDTLRNWIIHKPDKAIKLWKQIRPKCKNA